MSLTHVQEHVDLIAKHEQEFLAQRTAAERLSDNVTSFAGSFPFVAAHLGLFVFWITWNIWPHTHHFDPEPFSLLSSIVGLEAILLASFILMRQSRLSRRADQRDHLMLQILLLTEKEITAVLGVDRQIAKHVGIAHLHNQHEVSELARHTSIEDVAQQIRETLNPEEKSPDIRLDPSDPFRDLL